MSPRPIPLLVLSLCICLASCSLLRRKIEPQWVETQVRCKSDTVMYEVVHLSLQKAGYPVGSGADRGNREVVTGWFVSRAPFKSQGYRNKATVSYAPVDEDHFQVHVRVQHETNESLRPLQPPYDKWEEAEDDLTAASRILQYVQSYLAEGEDFELSSKRLRDDGD